MRLFFAMLLLALLGGLLSACADRPAVAPAAPAAVAVAPAAPAAPTPADDTDRRLRAQGYTVQVKNDQKVYCRREEKLGSRVSGRTVCATAEQIKSAADDAAASAEYLQRMSGTGCTNPCH